ncbi:murein biosynthesis integral membrane protein MurJ [Desulfovibrio sp. OttesenSCG-928-C14]|nr:murein biosynthesis integral membrane protein MurJ [Desulfovibrio sp. OttesenSCG-928-C14]
MNFMTSTQRLGPAALIMGASVFLSRFMGLIRDMVISYCHGAGAETDIYFASFVIPDFINYLLAGGYFSITLIPLLSRFFKNSEEDGWRFFSSAFWWIVIAISSLTALAWIFAAPLSALAAPGFTPEAQARLTSFLRIILPAQICFLPGACFTALLFMRRQFAVPALTPLIYNGCIIICGLIFFRINPEAGMEGFCWGVLAGAALGSLILPMLAVRAGGLKLYPLLSHPGLKKFILLSLPLMLGQSIVVLDEYFIRIFGSIGPEGSVSLLNYARRVMMVPVGVIAQAAGVASYPFLAALAAAGDTEKFNATLNKALLTALAVIMPLGLWMASCSEFIVRLLFEKGRFTYTDSETTGLLLTIMLLGVGFWAIQQIVGRGFYARENTLTPVLAGTLGTVLALPLYFWLGQQLGPMGVALAGLAGLLLYTIFLVQRWYAHYGGQALTGLGQRLGWLLLFGVPCALFSYWGCSFFKLATSDDPILGAIICLPISFLAFLMPYNLLCNAFKPELIGEIWDVIFRKAAKKKNPD